MSERPIGTVTFLFSDFEGSTRLLQQLRDRYDDFLSMHAQLLREAIEPAINGALNTLTKDGRIARLRQCWLGPVTANLPMLRESISRSTLRRRLGRKRAQLVLPLLDDSVARLRA